MPASGAMTRRALALCLALACFRAAAAQPSVTPGISIIAAGSGDVTAGGGAVTLQCTVTNPTNPNNPMAPAPTGTIYFVGVS